MEVDDLPVDIVDDDPGPEIGAAGNEDLAGCGKRRRGSDARKVAAVVVFHVEVRVEIDVDHLSAPFVRIVMRLISVGVGCDDAINQGDVGIAAGRAAHGGASVVPSSAGSRAGG